MLCVWESNCPPSINFYIIDVVWPAELNACWWGERLAGTLARKTTIQKVIMATHFMGTNHQHSGPTTQGEAFGKTVWLRPWHLLEVEGSNRTEGATATAYRYQTNDVLLTKTRRRAEIDRTRVQCTRRLAQRQSSVGGADIRSRASTFRIQLNVVELKCGGRLAQRQSSIGGADIRSRASTFRIQLNVVELKCAPSCPRPSALATISQHTHTHTHAHTHTHTPVARARTHTPNNNAQTHTTATTKKACPPLPFSPSSS